jgi:5,10-methylenetetrahydromethanopterin reductase
MRETIEVLRRLLHMERVTFHGEFHHVDGIELDVVHGRREPRHVPIYIGATGLKMMELAGEIADGVVLNYCVPPDYSREALAARSGRAGRAAAIWMTSTVSLVVCSVDHDRCGARLTRDC